MNKLPRSVSSEKWWMHGRLPLIFHLVKSELNHIIEFNQLTSSFIDDEIKKFRKESDDYIRSNKLDDEQADGYEQSNLEEFEKLNSFFPVVVRYSVLVSLCTLFETKLIDVCKELDRSNLEKKSDLWKDLPHKPNLDKIKLYLKNNFEIHISEHDSWQCIKDIFEIRNCIVHANGDTSLMKDPNRTHDAISRSKDIDLDFLENIVLSDVYIKNASELFIQFQEALESACKNNEIIGPPHWP